MPDYQRLRKGLLSIRPVHVLAYTPQQFISLFNAWNHTEQQVERLFTAEIGAMIARGDWGQCCRSRL